MAARSGPNDVSEIPAFVCQVEKSGHAVHVQVKIVCVCVLCVCCFYSNKVFSESL